MELFEGLRELVFMFGVSIFCIWISSLFVLWTYASCVCVYLVFEVGINL